MIFKTGMSSRTGMRLLFWLVFWLAVVLAAFPLEALDRDAFTFTSYSLRASLRPAEHEFDASGSIELRNDSNSPQKQVPLQISSSLAWKKIELEGHQPVAYIAESYTSDIDHTGALEEAIVTLPEALAPGATLKLEVSYGGEIRRSSGRLARIGAPESIIQQSDWDEIGERFGAVRGLGYVTWYPVSIEAVSLGEGTAMFDAVARWKQRHEQTTIHLALSLNFDAAHPAPLSLITNGRTQPGAPEQAEGFSSSKGGRVTDEAVETDFQAGSTPVFAFGEFLKLEGIALTVYHAPDQVDAARAYADSAEEAERALTDWFGPLKNRPRLVALRDPNAAAFESENLMLAPLRSISNQARQSLLARALVHGSIGSPRKWISEGLARFGQALLLERQAGRAAANEFLAQVLPQLIRVEREAGPVAEAAQRAERDSLIQTNDQLLYIGKAAYVWWMLRDIAGDAALTKALAAYRPEQDRDAAYMQQLIEAQSTPRRNWQAFFDCWVYHDYGFPDLRIAATNARLTAENTYIVSVTVENLTRVWVEVQVAVKGANGEARLARLQVPGNAKSSTRIAFQGMPVMAEINDGSVPELDLTHNTMPVLPPVQP